MSKRKEINNFLEKSTIMRRIKGAFGRILKTLWIIWTPQSIRSAWEAVNELLALTFLLQERNP